MSQPFTKEMRKNYTILVPNMAPIHWRMAENIFLQNGYKVMILRNSSRNVVDEGLKYVHNDMCYPALLVIGQMLDMIHSGKVDPDKTAVAITQTGGGCRASNYYFLLVKALEKAGYPQIPVISFNMQGMNQNPGFKLSVKMMAQAITCVFYGDILMTMANQTRPYEVNKGETDALVDKWIEHISECYKNNRGYIGRHLKKNINSIADDFASIKTDRSKKKIKVGVVGEIYMKYAPLGNNNLQDFLEGEGCEVMLPPLMGFALYCFSNGIKDEEYYGGKAKYAFIMKHIGMPFMEKLERITKDAIERHPEYKAPALFRELESYADTIIDRGCKMGEGWLLTAEMVELIKKGYSNIVTCQPFGCLPNHVCAKGMIRPLKEQYPESNIVPIDYDPSATKVNQENRIKLMLAVAREKL